MEDFLQIGIITSPHGLKGEVKVYPTTDDNKRFKKLKKVYVEQKGERQECSVESARFFKNMVILKLKEFQDINEVEHLRKASLLVERKDAVPLNEDEYFIADLIGLSVLTEDGELLGTLTDVMVTGANDVYVVKDSAGNELLIPAIKDCILSINLEKEQMLIHLLEGLRDQPKTGGNK